ncbi:MAG: hypothetical protein R3B96_16880 [Pirellulaceae bacterium]
MSYTITEEDKGKILELFVTRDLIGHRVATSMFTISHLEEVRSVPEIQWSVVSQNVGMGLATQSQEIKASIFQSVNPAFILMLGIPFSMLWALMGS